MKQGSTLFLRGVILLMGLGVLALSVFLLPGVVHENAVEDPAVAHLQYPFLAYFYGGTLPFFFALYQAFRLLGYIDADQAFSQGSVAALRNIKYAALGIIGLLAIGELFVMFGMDGDRAHLVALGAYTAFVTAVVATFAAVLQKLIQHAVDIKSEHDLTV